MYLRDLLETINRRLLDPISKRYFFVSEPTKLRVIDPPEGAITMRFHPDREDFGYREIRTGGLFFISRSDTKLLIPGSKIRLIEVYNVEITKISEDLIEGKYAGQENIQEIPKIHWVAEGNESPLVVKVPGPLFIDGIFNANSLQTYEGYIEQAGRSMRVGEIGQFVRFGFCRLDAEGIAIRTHK